MSLQEESCPVDLELLGDIYRSNSHGLDALIATVPPETRAMLALYCYKRGHLSSIGLAIAASCEEADLINAGGRAGSAIFEMARERPEEPRSESSGRNSGPRPRHTAAASKVPWLARRGMSRDDCSITQPAAATASMPENAQ